MENIIPTLGAIQSPPDHRDIYIGQLGLPTAVPSSFFIDIENLPVEMQNQIGCCVGCAAAKYKQRLDFVDSTMVMPWSYRFLYSLAKCQDGNPDQGTYPRLVGKILKDIGCSTTDTCPDNTLLSHEDFVYQRNEANIPQSAKDEAFRAKISGYAFVNNDIDSIKQAIFNCNGLIMLVQVGKEWWTDSNGSTWDKNRLLPVQPPVSVVSGHEIYVYGYQDTGTDTKIFFRNHWSDKWADRGNGYFLYSQYKKCIVEMITFTDIPNTLLEQAHNTPAVFKYEFINNMQFGDQNSEVEALQKALKMEGVYNYQITGYYGPVTQAAVLAFQLKYNISLSAYERYVLKGSKVGPKTLKVLNNIYAK
jgi:hypothetical protein